MWCAFRNVLDAAIDMYVPFKYVSSKRTTNAKRRYPNELWLSANDAYGVLIVVIQMTNSFTIGIDNQQRNINQLFMTMSCQKNVIYLILEILERFINILTVNLVENTIRYFGRR